MVLVRPMIFDYFSDVSKCHDDTQEENYGHAVTFIDSYLKGYGGVNFSNYYSRQDYFVHSSDLRIKLGRSFISG